MSDDKKPKDQPDPLYLNAVYPDPSLLFTFGPKPLREVLDDAVFVLDTNALLVPYGTDPASVAAIRQTYGKLVGEGRLVVPAQTAREFAKNRPERLKELYDQLVQRQSLNLSPAEYPLLAELDEYRTLKKVEAELSEKLKAYRGALKAVLNQVRAWYWDDPVSAMYRALFTDKVVLDVPVKAPELQEDFAFRQIHRIPPGYKDGGKEVGASGDLIIWRTILEVGRTRKSHLVFVSGDEKSDWWHRASGGVLYPRFELLDEYRRASEGHTFHIIRLADLLAEFGARPEVVEAVREEEAVAGERSTVTSAAPFNKANASGAVRSWLARFGPVRTQDGILTVESRAGSPSFVKILSMASPEVSLPALGYRLDRAADKFVAIGASGLVVVVTPDERSALAAARIGSRHLRGRRSRTGSMKLSFFVGWVQAGEFTPVLAANYEDPPEDVDWSA